MNITIPSTQDTYAIIITIVAVGIAFMAGYLFFNRKPKQ